MHHLNWQRFYNRYNNCFPIRLPLFRRWCSLSSTNWSFKSDKRTSVRILPGSPGTNRCFLAAGGCFAHTGNHCGPANDSRNVQIRKVVILDFWVFSDEVQGPCYGHLWIITGDVRFESGRSVFREFALNWGSYGKHDSGNFLLVFWELFPCFCEKGCQLRLEVHICEGWFDVKMLLCYCFSITFEF